MPTIEPITLQEPSALIAEDNDIHRTKLEMVLRKAKWAVTSTADSRFALEKAMNARFDVLILDQRMPPILGLDVARRLKENSINAQTPVVMVTSFPSAEFLREAKAVGVYTVLFSPVEALTLTQTLERILVERQMRA